MSGGHITQHRFYSPKILAHWLKLVERIAIKRASARAAAVRRSKREKLLG
jgi:hypothetical protein